MSEHVQRFVVEAFPSMEHPKLHPFHLHTACIFIGEDDHTKAIQKAETTLKKRGWTLIRYLEKATLIEQRVKEEGGEVWDAYGKSKNGSVFIKVAPNQPMMPKDFSMRVPRLDESFMDKTIERSGGHRLSPAEANFSKTRNADYLLDEWILELKTLEEERLLKEGHQENIAKIFAKYLVDDDIQIDFEKLDPADKEVYLDSICSPIRHALESASKQIKASKEFLKKEGAKGAVIILNNGYGSLRPDLLPKLAGKLARQHSAIDKVICISTWYVTNGFDHIMNHSFDPHELSEAPLIKLRDQFWGDVEGLMTDFARGGMDQSQAELKALSPIVFQRDGKWYRFVPSIPEDTLFGEASDSP